MTFSDLSVTTRYFNYKYLIAVTQMAIASDTFPKNLKFHNHMVMVKNGIYTTLVIRCAGPR